MDLIYSYSDKDSLVNGADDLKNAKDIVERYLTSKTPSEAEISKLIDLQYPKESTLDAIKKEWG
jgi:hypothetical protein